MNCPTCNNLMTDLNPNATRIDKVWWCDKCGTAKDSHFTNVPKGRGSSRRIKSMQLRQTSIKGQSILIVHKFEDREDDPIVQVQMDTEVANELKLAWEVKP